MITASLKETIRLKKRIQKYAFSSENTSLLFDMAFGMEILNQLPLVLVNSDLKVVVRKVASAKIFHKLLIMSNDYKLKAPLVHLVTSGSYNSDKKIRETKRREMTALHAIEQHIMTEQPRSHNKQSNNT